ncbi:inhibitory synaptic factor 1 [Triplophysa dalaica]|uniref:inhibitory synaptic factor 1 n=1 Tax=Triplophysa dalaica TaxID=1582913 RepID=UPI0024DFFDE6|nr:inhibitory synaptic factor 1 [Triplophysa dalaica]XP_056595712.1 inhibitory synaptic factor 1 [Triplophysa dalaica]XP_056595713.1 inhibitory synaptic factor 1 [Triplophysa dalaica]
MFHCAVTGPERPVRRAEIRRHIKMVMEQLEEVLSELKDVAKELREVVAQIDTLTSDITLNPEDDLTSTCCSKDHGTTPDDLFHTEMLSDNLELLLHNSLLDAVRKPTTARTQDLDPCRRSCGDLPALNGPLKFPDSPKACWLYGSGGRINYYDKMLYHALCCDDDDDENGGGLRSSRLSSTDSVFSPSPRFLTPTSVRKTYSRLDLARGAQRSCSTQTVSDKSTQTQFPYIPAKQKPSSGYMN